MKIHNQIYKLSFFTFESILKTTLFAEKIKQIGFRNFMFI